jgi:4-alpha-glucanotransferase
VKAPGKAFLTAVKNALGELPLIAEDLGVITPDVTELRDSFGLPGMRVIQFAFGGFTEDIFLPHNFVPNCISYTGTHDNDTTRGWYEKMGENERHFYRRYLDRDDKQVVWDLIRLTWMSVAVFALAPMQDFLNLGNEARMNYPGNPSGNWSWRMPVGAITPELKLRLKDINYLYDRKIRK